MLDLGVQNTIIYCSEVADQKKGDQSCLKLEELKTVFENLGCPQTHLTLKGLLREATKDDKNGALTFREFLAIFRSLTSGQCSSSAHQLSLIALL